MSRASPWRRWTWPPAGGHGGSGSAARHRAAGWRLFGRATADEQRWLVGLVTGETRQGARDGVMLQAIARRLDVPAAAVRRAAMLAGDRPPSRGPRSRGGVEALEAVALEVGRPVRPMLAGSAPTRRGASQAAAGVAVETKLDGIRLQAHVDHEVRLFTRTLEEVTDRMPEITEALAALPVETRVLDGEAIALRADGRPQPFQVTGARTASSADVAGCGRVPLTPFFFDLLHLDGVDLIDEAADAARVAVIGGRPAAASSSSHDW